MKRNQNTNKKVCKYGHDLTDPDNVYPHRQNGRVNRECKTCSNLRSRATYELKRERKNRLMMEQIEKLLNETCMLTGGA